MKLKQLITGGALAATVLTLGSAQAEQNPYEGIVFCKAQMTEIQNDASDLSVTLPFTTTGMDGKEYTHWNLGEIPPRGVADSWHSEKGPGKFVAHNNGRVGAYIYLTSAELGNSYPTNWYSQGPQPTRGVDLPSIGSNKMGEVFGDPMPIDLINPVSSLAAWRKYENKDSYCLAFTLDMKAKNPTWRMLDHWCNGSTWFKDDGATNPRTYIGAYMGHLDAGEYMPFDVKFWAPDLIHNRVGFTFKVEAASFPLWEHDVDVQ